MSGESGRSAAPAPVSSAHGPFAQWPDIRFTIDNCALAAACDVILLAVPPRLVPSVAIDFGDRLVISVMAGVTTEQLARQTGARRIIKATSTEGR